MPAYRLVDADNHYYEPKDAFTRYMASSDMHLAVRVEVRDGIETPLVASRPYTFFEHMFWNKVGEPGALRSHLKGMEDRSGDGLVDLAPPFIDRAARLNLMDEQGVEACIMLPTLAVCVEHFMNADPEITYKNFGAFNRWLEDDWGFGTDGRIFGVPMLSLVDLDQAVAELDRLLSRGAQVFGLRAGPAFGRSPGDPYFDPLWARINEARAVVAFHIGEAGYNEAFSVMFGEEANPSSHRQSAFQWTCTYGDRPIMDTIASLIYDNLFESFPNVRVASIENGSLWVSYLLKAMNKMNRMGRNGPWRRSPLSEKPSDIFKRHVFVAPYHEEDARSLVDAVGASQILFGSDYPHGEGLAEPGSYLEELADLSGKQQRMIMRSNTAELLAIPA